MSIRFTAITSDSCELTKRYAIEDGKVVGSAVAHMLSGSAQILEIAKLDELRDVLDLLGPHDAITAGVPAAGNTALTTRRGSEFNPDAVARTNENFRYLDTPALFPIDVDTAVSGIYRSASEVLDALEAASPWLRQAVRVARPSASSYVADRGLRGVHVYLGITRGTDTAALAQRLQIDQWTAGRGHVVISKSGALLVRQLSDAMVYQPSRLMFEAAPILEGVERVVPAEEQWLIRGPDPLGTPAKYRTDDGLLDVQSMPKVKEIDRRRFEAAVRNAKNAMRVEAKRVALDYHRANALAAGRDDGDRLGALALRALGDRVLPPSWPLVFEKDGDLQRGTVADAVRALDAVMGRRCADPFDATRPNLSPADLRAGEVCTMRGRPGIWSHKLSEFFAFGDDDAAELHHPLELAAERLCGTIEEWPDRPDKKRSSTANLVFAIKLLCREANITLSFDVCADTPVTDADTPPVGMWLDAVTRLGSSSVSVGTLGAALETVARGRPVDPWKDSILALPVWDKKSRIDTLFTDLFGAPGSAALTGAAQVFFAGIVMRQLSPGSPVPVVPVLIGDQGVDKSLFAVRLTEAMGWPAPTPVSFSHDERKMSMAAARSPVAELAEMSGLGKRDAEDVKRWTTDTQDVYRAPYARTEESHPRRFVLLGTGNKHELNRDETGNRRFMPVMAEHASPADWAVELPQILAEAKARFCCDRATYIRLIRTVPDMVKEYNAADMREGRGTVRSDLDDLLPPILLKLLGEGSTVESAGIRQALDASPSGRRYDARAVAAWLKTRSWSASTNARGMRTYRPPAGWVEAAKPDNVVSLDPFRALN